jgi:ubiquinone/menaquinone biosynthesis C-methylase UbiE
MTIREEDIQSFADFEKTSWIRLTEHYDSIAGRITRQAANAALDAVDVHPGASLLDVATGPGYVAAEVARRGATAVGIDFSPDMVEVARRQFPGIRIEVGDAQALEFPEGSFDGVICAFGLLHLPRPGLALTEAHRVLRRGGRYAFTVWRNAEEANLFGLIGGVVQKYFEPSRASAKVPSMFMLGDPWVSSALMDAAGFRDVKIVEIPCHFEPSSPAEMVDFLRKYTVRSADVFNQLAPARQKQVEVALTEEAARIMATNEGKIPCPALLVSGAKA